MKPRAHHIVKRAKLPPILEIDEDGVTFAEMSTFEGRRWSADQEETGVQLSDWPTELDD